MFSLNSVIKNVFYLNYNNLRELEDECVLECDWFVFTLLLTETGKAFKKFGIFPFIKST